LLFYFISLALLILCKKTSLSELGLCPDRSYLILAAILTGSIAFIPFVLDSLISLASINQYELFVDAINKRAPGIKAIPPSLLIEKVFLTPLLSQVFLIGFVTQQIMKKNNSITGIYGAGILFMLLQFDLSVGLFILGCLSALLLKKTGSLYPAIGLHMGCALAVLMVANAYPRLYTLVGLLY
jgi:membrane protease YdiL (CAAX protease family)